MNRRAFLASLGVVGAPLLLRLAPERRSAGLPAVLTLSGAGPQGRWFSEVAAIAAVLNDAMLGLTVNGVTGKGVSIGNIRRIQAGLVEGGRFYVYDLEDAHAGRGAFTGGRHDDVVVWMKLATNLFRVVAPVDVRRFSDLAGLRIAIGVAGSGDDEVARRILEGYGVTAANTSFQYLDRSEGQLAFSNGQVDAIAYAYTRNNRGHLGPVFAARPLGADVDFVRPDPDRTQAFLDQHRAFFLDTRGEPVFDRADLQGIAYATGLAIDRRLPDDLVHRMTRVVFDAWDDVLANAPWLDGPGEAGLDEATTMTTLPYHPGAERYFRERGVWPA
jgi:hypothetical protein